MKLCVQLLQREGFPRLKERKGRERKEGRERREGGKKKKSEREKAGSCGAREISAGFVCAAPRLERFCRL